MQEESSGGFTLGRLQDADLQALEGFARQLLQRAERRRLAEQRAAGQAVTRRGRLLSGGEQVRRRAAQGAAPSSRGRLVEDVLDAEGRQRLVGVGRRRELIERAAPPLVRHRRALGVVHGGHGGTAGGGEDGERTETHLAAVTYSRAEFLQEKTAEERKIPPPPLCSGSQVRRLRPHVGRRAALRVTGTLLTSST